MGLFSKKDNEQTEVKNWYADRYQRVLVQRNILALVTLVALIVVLFSTFTISGLTPLKSVQPFLIQVDERSGMTQVVNPLSSNELLASEALKQYFVVQYIRARESFDANLYQYNFEIVRLMSKPDIFRTYAQVFDPTNENSPIFKYGRDYKRLVDFKTVTFLNENLAQARIVVTEEVPRRAAVTTTYVISVNFEFVALELPLKDRYINPLGFQVINYRIDEEFTAK